MGKKKVQVKNYSDRKKMERDVEKMLNDGYHIESQTGKFDERPRLIRPLVTHDRITVTYVREEE